MHLINKTVVFRIDNGVAGEKFVQQRRPPWSINSSKSHHDAIAREDKFLGFTQDLPSLMLRLGGALFGDPLTVGLRIYARAAGKKHFRCCKCLEKIARAVEINATINIDISAARARAMNDRIEISFVRVDLFRVRYIDRVDRIRLTCSSIGFCPAFYVPASPVKRICSCLPDIAASGDQDSRHDS